MTYTGDVLIQAQDDGSFGITYENGQPEMTDGFETCILLAIFGESNVMNGMTANTSEKYMSTFPAVITRANVSDQTKNDGIKAIEAALAFMVRDKMASSVKVTGSIFSVYGIAWEIEISDAGVGSKYAINWEKGALTAGYIAK